MLVSDVPSPTFTIVQLHKFSNAVQQLGARGDILGSASGLRNQLQRLLDVFRENAVMLFPTEEADRTSIDVHHCLRKLIDYLKNLSHWMEALLRHLEKFPGVEDNHMRIIRVMVDFAWRLRVRSSCGEGGRAKRLLMGITVLGAGPGCVPGPPLRRCAAIHVRCRAHDGRGIRKDGRRARVLYRSRRAHDLGAKYKGREVPRREPADVEHARDVPLWRFVRFAPGWDGRAESLDSVTATMLQISYASEQTPLQIAVCGLIDEKHSVG
jgi:hypothetical protein